MEQFIKEIKGYHVINYNDIRLDDYEEPDPGWDVLVGESESVNSWMADDYEPKIPPEKFITFSVKSSRIPKRDNDEIHTAIKKRDFKILKNSKNIGDDLKSNYEVQVYYLLRESIYDPSLKIELDDLFYKNINSVIERLEINNRYAFCYIVGFVSREKIIKYSNDMEKYGHELSWVSVHSGYRKEMWKTPLNLGTSPDEFKIN